MVIHHNVKDFGTWKPVFDEHAAMRVQHGSKGYRLFRSTADPNELLIMFNWENEAQAREFAESPELKQVMERAGVTSEPHIHFWEEVEAREEGAEQAA